MLTSDAVIGAYCTLQQYRARFTFSQYYHFSTYRARIVIIDFEIFVNIIKIYVLGCLELKVFLSNNYVLVFSIKTDLTNSIKFW